ncbi:MAG: cell envelope biogenesis protein TolA, partial [Paracoccaceae bacterium]
DAAPDVTALAPVAPEVSPADPTIETPPVEVPSDTALAVIAPKPRPTDAPRIAPSPSDAPAPDAAPADQVVEETAPVPDETAAPVPEEAPVAPEEATTQTPVENNTAQVTESSAPLTASRPKARPEKPAPAEEPSAAMTAAAAPVEAAAPDATDQAALDAALSEALSGEASDEPAPGTGVAASGPPLTSGEKDAMRVAVKQCWVVDNGGQMADVVLTVGFDMSPDGRVVDGSIRQLDATGGDDTAVRTAFEAARRAILRCQKQGYPLPAEKYEQWKRTEIVFDPGKMRLR